MASLAKQYVYHKRLNNVVKIILKENIREYIFSLSLSLIRLLEVI